MACLLAASTSAQDPPPSPANLELLHRSGQTFVTWDEVPGVPEVRYRVYRSHQPFDEGNFAQAQLLAELPVDSGLFYPERYRTEPSGDQWAVRHFERYVIEDHGAELAPGRGLFVWTPDADDLDGQLSGDAYYAVTSVLDGVENNALGASGAAAQVSESVDEPLPVWAKTGPDGLAHVLLQYFDLRATNASFYAPQPLHDWYGLDPASPALQGATAYALSYVVAEPAPNLDPTPPEPLPLVVLLHGHAKGSYPANLTHTSNFLPALEVRPTDVGETWWFGYARDHDYRNGGTPAPGDAVRNFTEERVLRLVRDLGRMPGFAARIDAARTYVYGASMGGTGALAFAQRYPQVFAAGYASIPMTDFSISGTAGGIDWKPDVTPKWGALEDDLPIEIHAPEDWADPLVGQQGLGAWAWQDLLADFARRPAAPMAPFGIAHGLQDQVVEWGSQGEPTYASCDAARRAWGGAVFDVGHVWTFFQGLPPALGLDEASLPWHGLQARLDETLPGLSRSSADDPLPPAAPGAWNAAVDWSTGWDPWDGAPIDQPQAWGVSLRCEGEATVMVDVTPRRTQAFAAQPQSAYWGELRALADDALIEARKFESDAEGVLTLEQVSVDSAGVRVRVRPAAYAIELTGLVGGGVAEFELSDARPFAWQWLVVGMPDGGSFPLGVLGVDLDMGKPTLLSALTADAEGHAHWSVSVPAELSGAQLAFQAAEFDAKTPLLVQSVQ